jgi:hypothetical protein
MIPLPLVVLLCGVALADDEAELRAFFDDYVARQNAFDPAILELYAPQGHMRTLRDGTRSLELSVDQLSQILGPALAMARNIDDQNRYDDVRVQPHGDGWRITATRTSTYKCAPDPDYHLDVVKLDGAWRIVEEYTSTVSLPLCEPPRKLRRGLDAQRDIVLPLLPLDLDSDTRLVAVERSGTALVYTARIHTTAAADLDLEVAVPMLKQISVSGVCGTPEASALSEDGAFYRYVWLDRDDVELAVADVPPGLCSAMAVPGE